MSFVASKAHDCGINVNFTDATSEHFAECNAFLSIFYEDSHRYKRTCTHRCTYPRRCRCLNVPVRMLIYISAHIHVCVRSCIVFYNCHIHSVRTYLHKKYRKLEGYNSIDLVFWLLAASGLII